MFSSFISLLLLREDYNSMSGSFWKFGQDYSIESPVTKILNSAFIKIDNDQDGGVPTGTGEEGVSDNKHESSHGGVICEDSITNENEEKEEESSLPTTESEYENYRPNLEVLDDLLDDDCLLYTSRCV